VNLIRLPSGTFCTN